MLSYEPVLSHYYARFWNTSLLHMLYLVMLGPNNKCFDAWLYIDEVMARRKLSEAQR